MKRYYLLTLLCGLIVASLAQAALKTGEKAPDFTVSDLNGKEVSLSDYAGKWVVLEWFNPSCPFVKKFYEAGKMQEFQQQVIADGGVWLVVNSTNSGHSEFLSPEATHGIKEKWNIPATTMLIDGDGKVGRQYNAQTTPHMFVINPEGVLVYQGAIDDTRSTDAEDIAKARNYVLATLESGKAGRPIEPDTTRPYGCGVKY